MAKPTSENSGVSFGIPRLLAIGSGLLAVAIGLLVVAGWQLHWPLLIQLRHGLAPMQYNTALCFTMCGISLLAVITSHKRLAQVFGGMAALLSFLTLSQYVLNLDLGIDQFLMHAYVTVKTSAPGRMSPAAALGFMLLGLSLVIAGRRKEHEACPIVMGLFSSVALAVSVMALFGYALGIPGTYGWGQMSVMAIHSAVGLAALSIGVFSLAWSCATRETSLLGGPRWLPVPVGLGSIAAAIILSQALESRETSDIAVTTHDNASAVKHQISARIDSRVRALVRMANRWEIAPERVQSVWEADASSYLRDFPGFQAIEWVDSSSYVRWVEPKTGNLSALNMRLNTDKRRLQALEKARATGEPVLTRPLTLFQGGNGFLAYVPLFPAGKFDGYIVGVFRARELLDSVLSSDIAPGYCVSISDGPEVFYQRDTNQPPKFGKLISADTISQLGAKWTLRVWPSPEKLAEDQTHLSAAVLATGTLGSILLALTIFLAQTSRAKASLALEANAGLQREIAERQRAEEALRRVNILQYAILNGANMAMISTTPEGIVRSFNVAAERMLGYTPSEVVGRVSPAILHEPDEIKRRAEELSLELGRPIQPGFEVFVANARLGVADEREWTYVRKNGTKFPVQLSVTGLFDERGVIQGFLCIASDITARREVEEALRSSKERFRLMVAGVRDYAILMLDPSGRITSWNAGAQRIKGYAATEILGQHFSRFYTPEMIKAGHPEQVLSTALANGRYEEEGWRVRKDGTRFYAHVVVTVVRSDSGELRGFSKVTRDITALKEAQEELARARDAALESARLKSEFLANMSHEIRTPMNGVIGMANLLLATPLSDRQRRQGETIRDSAELLLNLLNDILDFSKIEAGKLSFESIDFKLRDLINGAVDLLSSQAAAKRIYLTSALDENLPPVVRGDPVRLRQVLTNLIGNAIKFTGRGGVVVRASLLEAGTDEITLRFAVEDTGIGIPVDARKNLFKVFSQADGSTTRKFGGTGLGLAICKQLVSGMKGEIQVESLPNRGSTFWFTVRFAPAAGGAPAAVSDARGFRGVRVLVALPESAERDLLRQQIESWKLEVSVASNSVEALEQLRNAESAGHSFDLAIMERLLPDADAFDVAEIIRADLGISNTRLILLSRFDQEPDMDTLSIHGFSASIAKPVRQSQLFDALATALGGSAYFAETEPAPEKTRSMESFAGARILLVEDNQINQEVALGLLEEFGCKAAVAADGVEALAAVERNDFDVILMDCQMPRLDGYSAAARIRLREASLPKSARRVYIMAMTANAMQGDRERCLDAGMNDYVAKPIRAPELMAALQKWQATMAKDSMSQVDGETSRGTREMENRVKPPVPTASSTPSPDSIVDWERPNQLSREDPKRLGDLIRLVLKVTPGYIASLDTAVEKNSANGVRQAAHKCKGSCAQVGLLRMVPPLQQLEMLGANNELGNASALLATVHEEYELARLALEDRLQSLSKNATVS